MRVSEKERVQCAHGYDHKKKNETLKQNINKIRVCLLMIRINMRMQIITETAINIFFKKE